MKNISILIFIMAITCNLCFGQMVSFTYDLSGNRTNRSILYKSTPGTTSFPIQLEEFNDTPGERTVSIFPNPVQGNMTILFDGLKEKDQVNISIFNSNGVLILQQNKVTSNNILDLSALVPGSYILLVGWNEEVRNWRIIKE